MSGPPPLTPYTPAPLHLPPPTPSIGSSGTNSGVGTYRHIPPVQTPMTGISSATRRAAPRFPSLSGGGGSMYPSHVIPATDETDGLTPLTPDAKRRRFSTYRASLPPPYTLPGSGRRSSERGELLPRPDLLPGRMQPPPRPHISHASHAGSVQAPVDPNLTLPPLQTSASVHTRSVEAMVMTIPYLNKIRVLSRISPHPWRRPVRPVPSTLPEVPSLPSTAKTRLPSLKSHACWRPSSAAALAAIVLPSRS